MKYVLQAEPVEAEVVVRLVEHITGTDAEGRGINIIVGSSGMDAQIIATLGRDGRLRTWTLNPDIAMSLGLVIGPDGHIATASSKDMIWPSAGLGSFLTASNNPRSK